MNQEQVSIRDREMGLVSSSARQHVITINEFSRVHTRFFLLLPICVTIVLRSFLEDSRLPSTAISGLSVKYPAE